MRRFTVPLMALLLLSVAGPGRAEVRRWRVGDGRHPWNNTPVTGRLEWGRGWAIEIATDDDGDGLVDEDPIELIDNDGDGLFNEDGPDPQIDNDGDGLLNEDPVNRLDDDGDGLIDEDPEERIDADLDGLFDEDGPDPQIDNDGDGLVSEDGIQSNGDDDFDGERNEDPIDGIDNDGDGLIDEDGPQLEHGIRPPNPALAGTDRIVTTWVRPTHLDSTRNMAILLNERFLAGEYGGVFGSTFQRSFMEVPSELGFRAEVADPIAADFESREPAARKDVVKAVDGDLNTALTSARAGRGGLDLNLMGFYFINRVVFRPRPSLPKATLSRYIIRIGDPSNISPSQENLRADKVLVPEVRGQFDPVVKDLKFDPPVLMGRIDIQRRVDEGITVETAEAGLFGEGFPIDARFTSEIIDVGTPTPRIRRYSRPWELFPESDSLRQRSEFPDLPGEPVNWGKVRWKARRIGPDGEEGKGNVRIQFRAGNALDTHLFARRLGPGIELETNRFGSPLTGFQWLKLFDGRIPERKLTFNELGPDLGPDKRRGWSFWSAPFDFEEGLIDESLPEEEQRKQGVPLPLPGGTRFIQFRILFDSSISSAIMLDYIEFDYDNPLVGEGIVAEIFPPTAPLGQETRFQYFIRPRFGPGDATRFNRIEIDVPGLETRIDTFKFDGQPWAELPVEAQGADPLLDLSPRRTSQGGQFAQATVADPATGQSKLLIKLPEMAASDFSVGEDIEIIFDSKLFRGSKRFSSLIWNDRTSERASTIPQPIVGGDASPEVATDNLLVVVAGIDRLSTRPRLSANPFTPNDDGINDQVTISFDLFLLLEQVDVSVKIFDLSGRRVRRLAPVGGSAAGTVEVVWDGRDAQGERVPPGLYLYKISLDTDDSSNEQVGTLALVY